MLVVAQGDIEFASRRIKDDGFRRDGHRNIRVSLFESSEPRHQPALRKHRHRGHPQAFLLRRSADLCGCRRDLPERRSKRMSIGAGDVCKLNATSSADEQADANRLL